MSESDFEDEAMRLVLAIRNGPSASARLKAAETALLSAYRAGVKSGREAEKQRASAHGDTRHASHCRTVDCVGQCLVR